MEPSSCWSSWRHRAPDSWSVCKLKKIKVNNLAGTRSKSHRGDSSQPKRYNYAINTKQRKASFRFASTSCRVDEMIASPHAIAPTIMQISRIFFVYPWKNPQLQQQSRSFTTTSKHFFSGGKCCSLRDHSAHLSVLERIQSPGERGKNKII